MSGILFRTGCRVTLVGGGDLAGDDLDEARRRAPVVVAADGGAGSALARGVMPDAVIGDLDSLRPEDAARLPAARVHRIDEQESTDFQKCLRSIEAPLILGIGFLGRRLDHSLAVCHAIAGHTRPCLLIGTHDVLFHAHEQIAIDLEPGTRVSLFPMREVAARSVGLRWPVDGLTLSPGGCIGTSNAALGRVRIEPAGPGLLVILPRSELDAALAAVAPIASGPS